MRLSPVGEIARRVWTRLAHRFRGIDVSDFVVMPNHIHGIVVISDSRRGTAVDSMDIDTDLFRRAPTDESQRWGMAMDAKMPHTEASRRAPTIFAIIRVHSWLIYSISARNKPLTNSQFAHILRVPCPTEAVKRWPYLVAYPARPGR